MAKGKKEMKPLTSLLLLLLLCSAFSVEARTWTTRDGWTLEAKYVDEVDGKITLEKDDGSTIVVQKEQLSPGDVEFLKNVKSGAFSHKIDVFSLSVSKSLRSESKTATAQHESGSWTIPIAPFMCNQQIPGTTLSLHIEVANAEIIKLLDDKSILHRFVDDRNNDLRSGSTTAKHPGDAVPIALDFFCDESKTGVVVKCSAAKRPAEDAKSIRLEGTVVLLCGMGHRSVKHKNISLKKPTKIDIAGIPVTVEKTTAVGFFPISFGAPSPDPSSQTSISLTSTKPLNSIKKITFSDSSGNAVQPSGTMTNSSGNFHQSTYTLPRELDVVTIEIEELERIESVTIPVAVQTDLGLREISVD